MRRRILLVEDTEDNRQIVRDVMESVGYELIEAEDGAAGERHHNHRCHVRTASGGGLLANQGPRREAAVPRRRTQSEAGCAQIRREAVVPCEGKEIVGAHAGALEAV